MFSRYVTFIEAIQWKAHLIRCRLCIVNHSFWTYIAAKQKHRWQIMNMLLCWSSIVLLFCLADFGIEISAAQWLLSDLTEFPACYYTATELNTIDTHNIHALYARCQVIFNLRFYQTWLCFASLTLKEKLNRHHENNNDG